MAGSAEEFEAMVCGNLDNSGDVKDTKIALGSLRVFCAYISPLFPNTIRLI